MEPVLEPQWQPHVQLSASAPTSHTPYTCSLDVGRVQPPPFYPHADVFCPLPTPANQQPELLPSQLQQVNLDYGYGLKDAKACSPLDKACSSLTPPTRQTPQAAQEKSSITLEPASEWAQRVAELQKPERSNPFQSSYRGRPMLIPKPGESEPRLYHPLPLRPGTSVSTGRMPGPPVGSEEDLMARLVRITFDYVFRVNIVHRRLNVRLKQKVVGCSDVKNARRVLSAKTMKTTKF